MRTSEHLGGRRFRVAAVGAVASAAALLLLAIGHGSPASASPTAAASGSVTIAIKGFEFRPAAVRVPRGTRVVWVNRDGAPHTATKGGSFDTGTIRKGKAVAVRFGTPGIYRYHCSIHPEMTGKVIVRG